MRNSGTHILNFSRKTTNTVLSYLQKSERTTAFVVFLEKSKVRLHLMRNIGP